MSGLLPHWPALSAFLAASLILAIMPGPGVFYIVSRSLVQGHRAGLASVAAVALGNLGNAFAAAIGLAALFAVSAAAFAVVKYAGALYLIYLGLKMWRGNARDVENNVAPQAAPLAAIFRDGLLVALLNPKTTLFFAAFLPQFLNPAAPAMPQSMLLGALFVAIAAVTDCAYALAAGILWPALTRTAGVRGIARRLGGGVLVGLGLLAAVSGGRGTR